jgi:hypothetical protein
MAGAGGEARTAAAYGMMARPEDIVGIYERKAREFDEVRSRTSLLTLCRQRFPDHDWIESDMRRLALDKKFNGIVACDSFFHLTFDDQRAMFDVFRAHAAPRAALMFTSGPEHGEAFGEHAGEALYHASLAPEEYHALLTAAGFDVVEFKPNDADCAGHTVWLAQRKS